MEIQICGLCKAYGAQTVLRDVSLSVPDGISCLMAPSGAGKTTLVRILLGLERQDAGEVRGLEGKRLSAVFQEDRLLEGLSARENLRFVLGGGYDAGAADALLARLGIGMEGDKPVREFSGGMRRRAALARALAVPFDFLALDEPFTGLDPDTRRLAIGCIRRCACGKTVLLVSHDPSDASALGGRIIALPGTERSRER